MADTADNPGKRRGTGKDQNIGAANEGTSHLPEFGPTGVFRRDREVVALANAVAAGAVFFVVARSDDSSSFASPQKQLHAVGDVDIGEWTRAIARDNVQIEIFDRLEDWKQRLVPRTEDDARADYGGRDFVGKD